MKRVFKMFGFGKGKIEIQLAKYQFAPGEIIEGSVVLNVKKPTKARAVRIGIIGERIQSSFDVGIGPSRNRTSSQENQTIFEFSQPLDGEKEYSGDSSYVFKLKIPDSVVTQPKIGEGTIGTLVKAAQILSGDNSQIKWWIVANLDIPGGLDISKRVQINVA
jgi:hypothetical protein